MLGKNQIVTSNRSEVYCAASRACKYSVSLGENLKMPFKGN